MKIVLAIATYNRPDHLQAILPHVLNQGFYKVYVFDDNSPNFDEKLLKKYSLVKFVRGDKDLGPAGNRNRILKEDMGDAIFFLDDDARLETPDVSKVVEDIFKTHPKCAIVSSIVLDNKRNPTAFAFERENNPLFSWVEKPFVKRLEAKDYDVPYIPVAWVLENAFAIRSKVFKDLGGFNEIYRKFHEGPDLCKRALAAGYEVAITNRMVAHHTEPFSAFHHTQIHKYVRSAFIWYWKYGPWRK